MKKFNELMYEHLQQDRNGTVIVDNLHAYARIAQRLRYFWDGLCLLGEDKLERSGILSCLVGIASVSQHAAESLGLTSEQKDVVNPCQEKDEQIAKLKAALTQVFADISLNSKPIPSHQIGKPRFSFEFDKEYYGRLETLTRTEE